MELIETPGFGRKTWRRDDECPSGGVRLDEPFPREVEGSRLMLTG